jgi:hypothetical protein
MKTESLSEWLAANAESKNTEIFKLDMDLSHEDTPPAAPSGKFHYLVERWSQFLDEKIWDPPQPGFFPDPPAR